MGHDIDKGPVVINDDGVAADNVCFSANLTK
jgi:hypothetical protein